MFSLVLLVEGRPDRGWSSSDVTTFEPRKPFVNPCLAQSFFFKSLSKHCDSSAAVFPKRKQNSMQTRSFKSAIEKSMKTMTEAQEKNHTDPLDLSSRTPLGQLMWRAVTYKHQVGADGSTAPLPSRKKKSHYFWVSPHTYLFQLRLKL